MIQKSSTTKNNHLLRTLIAPILFELCGIIPILLVVFGVINIGAGVALRNTLVYQYSFVFFILAAGFFSYSIYVYLREKISCSLVGLKEHRSPIIKSLIFLTVFEALILALLQFSESRIYGKSQTLFSDFVTIGPFLVALIVIFVVLTKFIKNERR